MIKKIICIFILTLIVLGTTLPAYCGFLDDWFTQKIETNAGYFEGQKRGYATGGSFSARYPVSNDYLVSFEPPKFKIGCGGIDLFLGGFSFLNFEYLVTKLQRIMTAGAAFAFDMALKTFCEECSEIMKGLENISNMLNSMQLNDCEAGKAIATTVMDKNTWNLKALQEGESRFKIDKGEVDIAQKIKDIWKSNNNNPTTTMKQQTSGCPAEIQDLTDTNKTVFEVVGKDKLYMSSDLVSLLRGLFGDVIFTEERGWHVMDPCSGNNWINMNNFYDGEIYKNVSSHNTSGCLKISDQKASILNYTDNMLSQIVNSLTSKSALSTEAVQFIQNLPAPVYIVLKTAVATGTLGSIYPTLRDIAARGYTYQVFSETANSTMKLLTIISNVVTRKAVDKVDCNIQAISNLQNSTKELLERVMYFSELLRNDYMRVIGELQVITDVANRYEIFQKMSYEVLASNFSPALARRVTGKR